ncbi:MAG: hypothetical protein IJI66_14455 [Erysipelotrichaceae bacterium]|nr:hypothetical protein [Erysipelotrichaceae bacterium]
MKKHNRKIFSIPIITILTLCFLSGLNSTIKAESGKADLKTGETYFLGDTFTLSDTVYVVIDDEEGQPKQLPAGEYTLAAQLSGADLQVLQWYIPVESSSDKFELRLGYEDTVSKDKVPTGIRCSGQGTLEDPYTFALVYNNSNRINTQTIILILVVLLAVLLILASPKIRNRTKTKQN